MGGSIVEHGVAPSQFLEAIVKSLIITLMPHKFIASPNLYRAPSIVMPTPTYVFAKTTWNLELKLNVILIDE